MASIVGNFNYLSDNGLPVGALDGAGSTGTFNYLNDTTLPTPFLIKPAPRAAPPGLTYFRSFSELLALQEALVKGPGKRLAELLTLLDQATLVSSARSAVVGDGLVIADGPLIWQVGKVLAEGLTLSDSAFLAPFGYITLSESLTATDSLVKGPGKFVVELFTGVDGVTYLLVSPGTTYTRNLGEILWAFEDEPPTWVVTFNRFLSEIFQLPDSDLKNDYISPTPILRENLYLLDSVFVLPEYLTPPSPEPKPPEPPENFLGSGIPFKDEIAMREITEGRTHVPYSDKEYVFSRLVQSWPKPK